MTLPFSFSSSCSAWLDFCHATPIVPRTRLLSEMGALWRPSRGVAQSLLLQTFAMPRLLYHELVCLRRWAPFGGHLGAWLSRFCYRFLPCHAYCTTNSFAFGDGRPLAAISGRGSVAFAIDFCHATPIVPHSSCPAKGPLSTKPVHFSTFLNKLLWNLNLWRIDEPSILLYNKHII